MPSIDLNAVWSTLLGGFAVVFAVLWIYIHLSAVRDLHENSPRSFS
jgi:hypothetical protein